MSYNAYILHTLRYYISYYTLLIYTKNIQRSFFTGFKFLKKSYSTKFILGETVILYCS